VAELIDSLTQGEAREGDGPRVGPRTLDQLVAERKQAPAKQQQQQQGQQQQARSGQQDDGGLFAALGPQQPEKRTILQVGRAAT
jgi:hypothetical protein